MNSIPAFLLKFLFFRFSKTSLFFNRSAVKFSIKFYVKFNFRFLIKTTKQTVHDAENLKTLKIQYVFDSNFLFSYYFREKHQEK